MKIFEVRCRIKHIDDARNVVEKIDGIYQGHYHNTDIIFKSKNSDIEGTIVLRLFQINNRRTKNVILTHKIAEWTDDIKTDKIILKQSFDTIKDALSFMIDHYEDSLKDDYQYSREGWEYHIDNIKIYIENIEKLGPTIEIEAENKDDIKNLLKHFNVTECFYEPTSEIMRKLLGKSIIW